MNDSGQSQFNQARIEWAIRLRYSPMPKLSMEWLASNLNAFRIGELRVVGKIWEVMMERDGELAVNADKRSADLAALEWSVKSDGSKDGDLHAEALNYFYEHCRVTAALDQDKTGGVSQLLYDMGSAHSYYYSAHEMLLRVDNPAAKEVTAEFRHTPIWFFESRRGYLGYMPHIFDIYGQPCVQGEWLTCVGNGWMRPLCMAYAMKWFPLGDWLTWCQRYGSGFLVGTTEATKGEPAWDEAQEALQTLASDAAVLLSRGVEIKFLEQSARSGNSPFEPLVERVDRLYAKCYRGVDLATGSRAGAGGGGGEGGKNPVGASIQAEESGIFLARDAAWATGFLRDRVDAPVIRYLFNQEPRAHILVSPPAEDTKAADIAAISALVPLGLPISLAEAYKRSGFTPPQAGDACLQPPAAPAAPGDDEEPDKNGKPPPAKAPAVPAAPVNTPAQPDPSARPTAPAQVEEGMPIGAGAQPGAVQAASPNMPDPQVQAAGFWSTVGATARAIFGPLSKTPPLPALAVAIPNAEDSPLSEVFTAASEKKLAAAFRADMAHMAGLLNAALAIQDDDLRAKRFHEILADYSDHLADTVLAPPSAEALASILGTAYLDGAKNNVNKEKA